MPTLTEDKSVLSWASTLEPAALDQARATASLPFVVKPLALMPDAHVGIGATVGSVIPTKGAIIPAAVGVDIGCGMIATETDAHRAPTSPTPSSRAACRIGAARSPRASGRVTTTPAVDARRWSSSARPAHRAVARPGEDGADAVRHARFRQPLRRGLPRRARPGLDRAALGHRAASATSSRPCTSPGATKLMKDYFIGLEDPDLAYLVAGHAGVRRPTSPTCCGRRHYALANRDPMMDNAMREVFAFLGTGRESRTINCHHNFTQQENARRPASCGSPARERSRPTPATRASSRARWARAPTSCAGKGNAGVLRLVLARRGPPACRGPRPSRRSPPSP